MRYEFEKLDREQQRKKREGLYGREAVIQEERDKLNGVLLQGRNAHHRNHATIQSSVEESHDPRDKRTVSKRREYGEHF